LQRAVDKRSLKIIGKFRTIAKRSGFENHAREARKQSSDAGSRSSCPIAFATGEWHLMRKAITEAEPFLIWSESFCPKTFYEWGAARAERGRIRR
jgi:hypothetical protein